MNQDEEDRKAALEARQGQGIRFLVEQALRSVASTNQGARPRTRRGWIEQLCLALVSESETSHKAVISSLISTGVTQRELLDSFLPEASRALGEMWTQDQASFVDVTVGASRIQTIYRDYEEDAPERFLDRSIPLGQSVLMVVPEFEQHSLGAFVAADRLRRYGLWVRMGIGLNREELTKLVAQGRFSMIGFSVGSSNAVEKTTKIIDDVRTNTPDCPPVVVGGSIVEDTQLIERRTGADHAVRSIREAVERCGLTSVVNEIPLDSAL